MDQDKKSNAPASGKDSPNVTHASRISSEPRRQQASGDRQTDKTCVKLRLDLRETEFEAQEFINFVAGLINIGVEDIELINVRVGSIIVVLELPRESALRLVQLAADQPEAFEAYHLVDILLEEDVKSLSSLVKRWRRVLFFLVVASAVLLVGNLLLFTADTSILPILSLNVVLLIGLATAFAFMPLWPVEIPDHEVGMVRLWPGSSPRYVGPGILMIRPLENYRLIQRGRVIIIEFADLDLLSHDAMPFHATVRVVCNYDPSKAASHYWNSISEHHLERILRAQIEFSIRQTFSAYSSRDLTLTRAVEVLIAKIQDMVVAQKDKGIELIAANAITVAIDQPEHVKKLLGLADIFGNVPLPEAAKLTTKLNDAGQIVFMLRAPEDKPPRHQA